MENLFERIKIIPITISHHSVVSKPHKNVLHHILKISWNIQNYVKLFLNAKILVRSLSSLRRSLFSKSSIHRVWKATTTKEAKEDKIKVIWNHLVLLKIYFLNSSLLELAHWLIWQCIMNFKFIESSEICPNRCWSFLLHLIVLSLCNSSLHGLTNYQCPIFSD